GVACGTCRTAVGEGRGGAGLSGIALGVPACARLASGAIDRASGAARGRGGVICLDKKMRRCASIAAVWEEEPSRDGSGRARYQAATYAPLNFSATNCLTASD